MASVQTEASFLASFLAEAALKKDSAVRIMAYLQPAMLEYEQFGEAYAYVAQRFAAGQTVDDLEVQGQLRAILGDDWYVTVWAESQKDGDPARVYAAKVLRNWRARRQIVLLEDMVAETTKLVQSGKEELVARSADELVGKLIGIHASYGDQSKPVTRDEITAHTLAKVRERKGDAGIRMPYQKLATEIGNLIPGDVVGVVAYSNGGKSLLAANFWRHFAISGVPSISFPTEMGLAWYQRAVAAHARIPQIIAEREQWSRASEEQLEDYTMAVRDLGTCPWEICYTGSTTVEQILARAAVLRKRWRGKTVVLIVDHMHDLDYGREEADWSVGPATKKIRDFIRADEDGGMIAILLYQPRKPADDIELYKPVLGYQIRGGSQVWNVLDIQLSPYRRWVEEHPTDMTKWGTPAGRMKDGRPVFAAPNKDGAKLDDERMYVKLVKRRSGGEGPTIVLPIDGPTGHIRDLTVDTGRDALVASVR